MRSPRPRRMRRSELALLVLLAACRGSTTPDERPIVARDAAPRSIALGAPCDVGPECGTKQHVSVEENVTSITFKTPSRCTIDIEREVEVQQLALMNGTPREDACIAEGKLWGYRECAECRNVAGGYSVVAQLDELTPAQAIAIQTKLRLPASAPLVGEAAWRQAIAAKEAARPRSPKRPAKPQGDASTSRLDDVAAATFTSR